jgi:hypothetical protein
MDYLQNNTYRVKYRNNAKWNLVNNKNFMYGRNIVWYNEGKLIKGDRDILALKQLIKNGDIKIRNKRVVKKNTEGQKHYVEINYEWLKFDNNPNISDYKKVQLLDEDGRLHLDKSVIMDMLAKVEEKMSGINISYYQERNVIEFRYLSSEILGSVDEFFKYVNYFMYLPMIAMRSKRIRIGDFILQKKENEVIAIASPKENK